LIVRVLLSLGNDATSRLFNPNVARASRIRMNLYRGRYRQTVHNLNAGTLHQKKYWAKSSHSGFVIISEEARRVDTSSQYGLDNEERMLWVDQCDHEFGWLMKAAYTSFRTSGGINASRRWYLVAWKADCDELNRNCYKSGFEYLDALGRLKEMREVDKAHHAHYRFKDFQGQWQDVWHDGWVIKTSSMMMSKDCRSLVSQ